MHQVHVHFLHIFMFHHIEGEEIHPIHWSTKSAGHDIKKIPNVGFNATEDDPTILVAEVSSHWSHECDL